MSIDTTVQTQEVINLLTRDNITLALAILGSVGTLFTFVMTFLANRTRINLRFKQINCNQGSMLSYVAFENKSRLPIAITDIAIINDDICYPCVPIATSVCEYERKRGNQVISHREDFSIPLPITLSSLAGTSGYVYFDRLPDNFPTSPREVTLQVSTNRGRTMKMTLAVDC